ncbi:MULTISPECIES: alpha/beta fold hydrolase [Actinosynnema]|uniref:alpha/beta fold hydrolase n=1 Tax=Actinosynnema TaxID=40566 RepID=UPI0020A58A6D|nr:alpha/beta hydrolase [Actinosynnema pretiosum]MCP2099719.1 Pimeloyl-ACP methyl ester carboxylesterase [Actinosynnema pretiosum]
MEKSQLTPHRALRVDLPSRHGHLAALRAPAIGVDLGATALLLPGFTGGKEDFAPLLDPIADAGFEVVSVDLPGQHESPGSEVERDHRPQALGAVVAELVGKLAAEGRRVLLLGHSFGGLVARGAVLAGARVSGLTLLSSGPSELPQGARRTALEAGERLVRERGLEAAYAVVEARRLADPLRGPASAELVELWRTRYLRSGTAAMLGMGEGLRVEPDLVAKLARALRVSGTPALVVCGDLDDAWSPIAQRDMAERLDADFGVLPGVGHSPNTEAPEELLGVLLPTWRSWLG